MVHKADVVETNSSNGTNQQQLKVYSYLRSLIVLEDDQRSRCWAGEPEAAAATQQQQQQPDTQRTRHD